ncbi:GNAT family N-acetyltransferase [Formosa sediminum]|uniref:GNAT family N-acetyltransferase n=1 Tax=Formosa sediminum TaxID=2594004 RepID=A0A516GM04_9FLAO|nr:GNAT family N-acetyltransferase [Formosa sediminum]QDO92551.1 GNAT family N-acetyltransferase [Formosa sediminum]
MNQFRVERYNETHLKAWNMFVSKAKNATFLFHRDFMDYHKDRFTDCSLLVYKNNKLIAVLPANIKDQVLYSHQGLTYGGIVLEPNTKFKIVFECFKAILKWLYAEDVLTFNIKILPAIYSIIPNDELLYLMFLMNANLYRRDLLSVINLQAPLPFSKSRLEGCKRAKKHQIIIKEEQTFDAFWNTILIPNLSKKHQAKPVHSLEEITLLKTKFPEQIRQFNAYYNGQIVAGTTVFVTDVVAHSQYISGNASKNELGSLDVLHAHLIQTVFKDKLYFDFGTSNENNGKQLNEGLQFWKEGFGARTIIQDFYSLETKNVALLDAVLL